VVGTEKAARGRVVEVYIDYVAELQRLSQRWARELADLQKDAVEISSECDGVDFDGALQVYEWEM